jgi:hypothetical protein
MLPEGKTFLSIKPFSAKKESFLETDCWEIFKCKAISEVEALKEFNLDFFAIKSNKKKFLSDNSSIKNKRKIGIKKADGTKLIFESKIN